MPVTAERIADNIIFVQSVGCETLLKGDGTPFVADKGHAGFAVACRGFFCALACLLSGISFWWSQELSEVWLF